MLAESIVKLAIGEYAEQTERGAEDKNWWRKAGGFAG